MFTAKLLRLLNFAPEFPLMSHLLRRLTCLLPLLLAALCAPALALAQDRPLELDIIGGNAAALPIAVVPMPYQGSAAAPEAGFCRTSIGALRQRSGCVRGDRRRA